MATDQEEGVPPNGGGLCAAIKSAMCSYRHGMGHREGRVALWLGGIGGLATGTGVLWESPSRQRELAIYVVPQALTTVWNMARLVQWHRHHFPPRFPPVTPPPSAPPPTCQIY